MDNLKLDKMNDDNRRYAELLLWSDPLRESVFKEIIEYIKLDPSSQGLDAGCGIGSHSLMLAQAISPDGHVTGIDTNIDFLKFANIKARGKNLSQNVTFTFGNAFKPDFPDGSFDWFWSVDCVGSLLEDPERQLSDILRVIKPGGRIFLISWTSQMLLPGFPMLEAKLNATPAGIAPFREGMNPELHFMKLPYWFSKLGMSEIEGKTFVGNIQAPVPKTMEKGLATLFEMRWAQNESDLDEETWQEFKRLCDPESPNYLPNTPNYYAFFTYTLFTATK